MKELPEDAGNAMASVAAAGYTIRFREGREPEFDYITGKFGYPSGVVQYTGFARYDTLHDAQTKNRILIMPTWRMYITNENSFMQSEYYRQWNEILQNKHLVDFLEKKDLSVVFYSVRR